MNLKYRIPVLALLSSLGLASCSGGSTASGASSVSEARRAAAATDTAQNEPLCTALSPFYWEIGDSSGALVSGSVGGSVDAGTAMSIASASKWLYAAYVVEKQAGVVDAQADVPFLNFTSGYSNFATPDCPNNGTVAGCLASEDGSQNTYEAQHSVFHYNSGHMQKHAVNLGLGPLVNSTLAAEIRSGIGTDVQLIYSQPQLAGGVATNAANYAGFLRKLLADSPAPLRIGALLGTHVVCTLPGSPGCNAAYSPIPEAWHYSLGHWVEDDPNSTPAGDGAFSSAGAFGFYPWVDSSRSWYGIVAREDQSGQQEGYASVQCGRLIRRAWVTGEAQ